MMMKTRYKALAATAIATAGIITSSLQKETAPKELYIYYSLHEIYNHSVGDEFTYSCSIGDTQLSSGACVSSIAGEDVVITVNLIEQEKHPDTGEGSIAINIKAGAIANTEILLTEDNGRYKGNQALIEIKAKIIEK